jgi:hypothetical protein
VPEPVVLGKEPKVTQAQFTRESLPHQYRQMLLEPSNGLLARMEGQMKSMIPPWTDEEIRTAQLLVALVSNASLYSRLLELEASLGKKA